MALMARFYGWEPEVIKSLSLVDFNKYLECIEPITAIETLREFQVSSFPHNKQEKTDEIWKSYKTKAAPYIKKQKAMTTEQLDMMLRAKGL